MIEGSCLCGHVRWSFAGRPDVALACNCTACRRYGVLWAYGHEDVDVAVSGETRPFVRGEHSLEFHFCPTCGCLAFWRATRVDDQGRRRIGINLRLAEPADVGDIPVDRLDGLNAFEPLPRDGKCVADYWF